MLYTLILLLGVAWQTEAFSGVKVIDLAQTDSALKGFIGGFSDGTYGYLVPYHNAAPAYHGKVARFQLNTFGNVAVLDLSQTDSGMKGYVGGFEDGTYGYLIPMFNGADRHGKVARFQLSTFSNVAVLDLTQTDSDLKGYWGGFTHDNYAYLVPYHNAAPARNGKVARFQLSTFGNVAVLDLTQTDNGLKGFNSGFTDGTYGYMVPYHDGAAYFGKVARFQLSTFSNVAVLNLAQTDSSLVGLRDGFTDGTYGYLVPYYNSANYAGKIPRFQLSTFSNVAVLDLTQTDSSLLGWLGGFTDGTHGYLVPYHNNAPARSGKIVRFQLSTFGNVAVLDLTQTDSGLKGFHSCFSDGSYGYAIPYHDGAAYASKMGRFGLATTPFSAVTVLDLTQASSDLKGFNGGFADGTYGYLVPSYNGAPANFGKVPRFQSNTFSNVAVLDLTQTDSALKGFVGGFSDGTYAYLVPHSNGAPAYFGKVARFQLSTFSNVAVLDLTQTDSDLKGYTGGFADGTYGYLVPYHNAAPARNSKVARFQLSTFGNVAVLDLTQTDSGLKGFHFGFEDGTYGYLVPHHDGAAYFGEVVRFQFSTFGNVAVLDLAQTDSGLKGFIGGFTDGTYGYIVPHYDGAAYSGKVARFQLSTFSNVAVLDLTQTESDLNGYYGGFVDDHYGYLVPFNQAPGKFGKVARFQLSTFGNVDVLDLTQVDSSLKGFAQGFSDGTYGYMVPHHDGTGYSGKVARFLVEFTTTTTTTMAVASTTGTATTTTFPSYCQFIPSLTDVLAQRAANYSSPKSSRIRVSNAIVALDLEQQTYGLQNHPFPDNYFLEGSAALTLRKCINGTEYFFANINNDGETRVTVSDGETSITSDRVLLTGESMICSCNGGTLVCPGASKCHFQVPQVIDCMRFMPGCRVTFANQTGPTKPGGTAPTAIHDEL